VNRFIGSSLVVTTISSYTLKITVTIAHVTSHTKSSNSSSSHTAVPSELRNSSEVNSHSRILSYPLGTDHAQKTQPLYCCMAQNTQKTSHVITISPVHLFADCCLATSNCWVTWSEVFIGPFSSCTRDNINILSSYLTGNTQTNRLMQLREELVVSCGNTSNSKHVNTHTDFKLSGWLIIHVNYFLGFLHRVVLGDVPDVSEVHVHSFCV
jgi:hypothetical protein